MAEQQGPYIPGPVAAVAKGAFRAVAMLRGGKRALHPDGVVFSAELFLVGDERSAQGSILGEKTKAPAIARLSRAVGLPEPLPDALGIAIAVSDLGRPGSRQDLLFTSSTRLPGGRHLPLPAPRGFFGHTFTSLWPYRVGGQVRMLGLRPPEDAGESPADIEGIARAGPGARYRLLIAELEGPWQALGELVLRERLEGSEAEEIRFSPWNTADSGLRPVGPLMRVREPAYEGSQEGRGADPEA